MSNQAEKQQSNGTPTPEQLEDAAAKTTAAKDAIRGIWLKRLRFAKHGDQDLQDLNELREMAAALDDAVFMFLEEVKGRGVD